MIETLKRYINFDDNSKLWQYFKGWKERHCLTKERENNYMFKLKSLIDKRVKAILVGNYRNHYGSVAALAAALGEVKESWGEAGAKERIMQNYRQLYSRRSSFHTELRRYGMSDNRKR